MLEDRRVGTRADGDELCARRGDAARFLRLRSPTPGAEASAQFAAADSAIIVEDIQLVMQPSAHLGSSKPVLRASRANAQVLVRCICMSVIDDRDPLDAAIARHYARDADGLPPPCEPHPGNASVGEAMVAHRRWLREHYPQGAPAVVLSKPPPAE